MLSEHIRGSSASNIGLTMTDVIIKTNVQMCGPIHGHCHCQVMNLNERVLNLGLAVFRALRRGPDDFSRCGAAVYVMGAVMG